jgi:soluble lytic murein transglycosylase-like protein
MVFGAGLTDTCPMKPSSLRHLMPLLVVLLAQWAASGAVHASRLYRCVGEHGETVFTSSRAGYTGCKALNVPTTHNSGQVGPATPAPATAASGGSAPATASQPAASPVPAASGVLTAAPAAAPQRKVEFRTRADGAEIAAPEASGGARVTRGAVYRYVKDGVTHYTNRRPAGQRAELVFSYMETCYACAVSSSVDFNAVGLNLTAYADEVRQAALLHGVEEALVRAVIHAESAFNLNALSNKGAQGLMQLMPATAARFGVVDPFSPVDNISGGTAYLAWLLKRFDGDVRLAVAGYNAGEGSVDRFGGIPPYAETQVFVERVGILLSRYRTELAAAPSRAGAG